MTKPSKTEQAYWDDLLASEGLGVLPDIIAHTSCHVRIIAESRISDDLTNITAASTDYTSTATFRKWYELEHRANALHSKYRHKPFLIDCTITGDIRASARKFGISIACANVWFGRFRRGELEAAHVETEAD